MSDTRLRELERAALSSMAPEDLRRVRSELLRARGEDGWTAWAAEHLGAGPGAGDLLLFRHPISQTVHAASPNTKHASLCGGWTPAGERQRPVGRWGLGTDITCKNCKQNLRWARNDLGRRQAATQGVLALGCLLGEHEWTEWADVGVADRRSCVLCDAEETGQATGPRLFA